MQMARLTHGTALTSIAGGAGPAATLKQAWADFRQGALSRKAAQETVQALAELDDASLADIGLHRSQILSIAMNPNARFR